MTSTMTATVDAGVSHPRIDEHKAVLILLLKVGSDGADVTLGGRRFHAREAAAGNARSTTVDSFVGGRSSCAVDVDRSSADERRRRQLLDEVRSTDIRRR